jgi:hypothetical protein
MCPQRHLAKDSFNDTQSDAQLQDGISNNIVRLTETPEIKVAIGYDEGPAPAEISARELAQLVFETAALAANPVNERATTAAAKKAPK